MSIRANITCRDRFNGTPLEDAVRHHFDLPHMDKVQDLLREHGATLAGIEHGIPFCRGLFSYIRGLIRILLQGKAYPML